MAQYIPTYGEYENEFAKEYVSTNDRMYVHSSVYLPSSEVDPRTGFLKPDSPRRGRTQAKMLEYQDLNSEYKKLDAALKAREENPGIRITMRVAFLLITLFSLFCGLVLLAQQGELADREKALAKMNENVEAVVEVNEMYASQIAEASDSAKICYAAARDLNMIPADAAEAIHLVAMDTRPTEKHVSIQQPVVQQPANSQANMTLPAEGGAVVDGQATQIPALASANGGY